MRKTDMHDRSPTRRCVLAGLAAAATVGGFGPAGRGVARAATAPFRTGVGSIDVMALSDGTLDVPLSFTLPETPRDAARALLTAHGLPPDGMPAQTNVTLVRNGRETVLIDAGAGANFQATAGRLGETLEAAAIDPAGVTAVVFTHGHADHLWGVIDELDDLRFPNARYVISAAEWDFWTDPATVSAMPDAFKGMAAGSARILRRLGDRVERRRAGDTVAPGLTYVEAGGHTPGHMAVMVEQGGDRLLVTGDVLTHPVVSFARPGWRMGADHDRDRGVVTRRRMLDWLATDRIPFVGFHLPWPGHGAIERFESDYRYVPRGS